MVREEFVAGLPALLAEIQATLHAQARARLEAGIERGIAQADALSEWFDASARPGWAEVNWSKPTGAALDKVVEWLKARKLTLRNAPLDAAPAQGACIFTGEPAIERVLVGRAY